MEQYEIKLKQYQRLKKKEVYFMVVLYWYKMVLFEELYEIIVYYVLAVLQHASARV